MTSNESSSIRFRCAFDIDLGNVTEVTLGRNETETGSWEILLLYSVDNATHQFINMLAVGDAIFNICTYVACGQRNNKI